ncbi:MAG: Holliday junction branch migration protein RuvA [Faecalicoccus sp.]|nr:Holliday junction branch migration protein RuvA [Faecalicoccus sp.]
MIAFVNGIVRLTRKETVVIDVNGVGYEVYMANSDIQTIGDELFLYTYQHVREDAILLYGFVKENDYEVFMRLINVKGIGPKTALNMLGAMSGDEMIEAIENDDVKRLKTLPGIGARTASQIVLDLKGKFVAIETTKEVKVDNPVWKETEEALMALGYRSNQLSAVRKEFSHNKDLNVNDMLRKALAFLAKRNGV